MKTFSHYDVNFKPVSEQNSPIRHKDFDDSVVTNIYDFMDMFANGRDIPVMKRQPVFDENADELFDKDITPPENGYDMLDALDDSQRLNATTTTTNDDDDAKQTADIKTDNNLFE